MGRLAMRLASEFVFSLEHCSESLPKNRVLEYTQNERPTRGISRPLSFRSVVDDYGALFVFLFDSRNGAVVDRVGSRNADEAHSLSRRAFSVHSFSLHAAGTANDGKKRTITFSEFVWIRAA